MVKKIVCFIEFFLKAFTSQITSFTNGQAACALLVGCISHYFHRGYRAWPTKYQS